MNKVDPAHLPGIRDAAAIVGIGQTPFAKSLGRSEPEMAVDAIWAACEDAGLSPREIDGLVRYDMEQFDEEQVLAALGNPLLRWFCGTPFGGGGSASVVVIAAAAIAAGMADTVLVYRSRARGKASGYGRDPKQGGRYWEKLPESLPGLNQWHVPQGLVSAFQEMAMISMRHRIDHGTTDDQYADVAIAFRDHAIRNPAAVMRTPMTRADHHASRMIADPLRLFDCNIETDGAVAMILTSTERARDLRHVPAVVLAAAQGCADDAELMTSYYRPEISGLPEMGIVAEQLWRQSGLRPADVQTAFLYDHFTPFVLVQLEELGFCKRGEAKDFATVERLSIGGELPINTSGGLLGEAYIHGMNGIAECVRQIRGTSCNQVDGVEHVLATAGTGCPTSGLILGRV